MRWWRLAERADDAPMGMDGSLLPAIERSQLSLDVLEALGRPPGVLHGA